MRYLVDDIEKVVELMRADKVLLKAFTASGVEIPAGAPFYMFGHRLEINNRLKEMEKDNVRKYQKYPLVALRLDISEQFQGGLYSFTLNMAVLMSTDKGLNAEERMVKVFKPILYPLYTSLMTQLQRSDAFLWTTPGYYPPHTKIDRPFWGTPASPPSEGNQKFPFDDPLDAIEIVNLQMKSVKKC